MVSRAAAVESERRPLAESAQTVADHDLRQRIVEGIARSAEADGLRDRGRVAGRADARGQAEEAGEDRFIDLVIRGSEAERMVAGRIAGVVLALLVVLEGLLRRQ